MNGVCLKSTAMKSSLNRRDQFWCLTNHLWFRLFSHRFAARSIKSVFHSSQKISLIKWRVQWDSLHRALDWPWRKWIIKASLVSCNNHSTLPSAFKLLEQEQMVKLQSVQRILTLAPSLLDIQRHSPWQSQISQIATCISSLKWWRRKKIPVKEPPKSKKFLTTASNLTITRVLSMPNRRKRSTSLSNQISDLNLIQVSSVWLVRRWLRIWVHP